MGQWIKPAGGSSMTGDQGSYTGYVKVRDEQTIKSDAVKEQNQEFRKAANQCEGKDRSEFRSCMSEQLS